MYLVLVDSSLVKLIPLRVVSSQAGVLIEADTTDLAWGCDPRPSHVRVLLVNHVSSWYSPGFWEQMARQSLADHPYTENSTGGTSAHPAQVLLT